MELGALPDLVLLEVLSLLDTRQLLEARRVCRRWRDLALEPRVWERRAVPLIHWKDTDLALAGAALLLAPCLARLELWSDAFEKPSYRRSTSLRPLPVELLASTSCGVSSLDITMNSPLQTDSVVLLLERQAALGRLQTLSLKLPMRSDLAAIGRLLGAAAACRPRATSLNLSDNPVPASLLESSLSLRELRFCPLLDNMALLLERYPGLTSVEICVDVDELNLSPLPERRAALQALATFLRGATQLTHLELNVSLFGDDPDPPELLEAVSALGSGPSPSALRWLDVVVNAPRLERLAAALPGMPHLRELRLYGREATRDFLAAITPASAPSLRYLYSLAYLPCPHDWCHQVDAHLLLRRMPALHLEVVGLFCPCGLPDLLCAACQLGDCHPQLRAGAEEFPGYLQLYGHPEEGPCDWEECAEKQARWLRLQD